MKRTLRTSLASLGLLLVLAASPALAQYYGPGGALGGPPGQSYYRAPVVSPYLNLLRNNNNLNPAVNYYLGVLPEFDRRATKYRYGVAISDLERRTGTAPSDSVEDLIPPVSSTGHPVQFLNSSPYYSNLGVAPRLGPTTPPQGAARRTR